MPLDDIPTSSAAAPDADSQVPVYARVAGILRDAIGQGTLAPGIVLLEEPLSQLLGATRTPIRQALQQLEQDGVVSRFDGRGYLAGAPGVTVRRVAITPDMLGLDGGASPIRKVPRWELIYNEVERELIHLSVFGRYRVNEVELARHHGVSRIVAHDVMLRIESLGLAEKDERQRWVVSPLDDARIVHLYELRWLLEPAALQAAAAHIPATELREIAARLRSAMRDYTHATRETFDALEHDLHVRLLSYCPNADLLKSLQRTRGVLMLSKHVLGFTAPMPPRKDTFLAEHRDILNAVQEEDVPLAAARLREHLQASCEKVLLRAKHVRTHYAQPLPGYVTER
ncbi:GntR family transcriptional regulator [Pandoraea capi]|nr:GntR family transcriptional regulator [Pandoraea sp. LA3]MDN4584435.1 GntR family transcriptional regulator [Pandoraea capi]